ncbi:accessory gene regulator ArgB-like protein [Cohnella pontilimi]|uniref:accessory gene regulator ArgB-like protein n=1 Tax=Cohnella pontilimi TaxID=2564100 RepID=UPI00145F9F8F|nr:accessory gene regulator B family protein [Cohnella pontilimi]
MIDAISRKLAVNIKQANPEHPASVEVMRYAIASILNLVATILISIVAAYFFDHVANTVLALAAFLSLRMISGGRHLDSSVGCLLLTVALSNIIPFLHLPDTTIYILTSVSIVIAFFFAPCNMERTNRIPKRFYPLLKYLSMLYIASNLLILSTTICICFFIQCLTIIQWRR